LRRFDLPRGNMQRWSSTPRLVARVAQSPLPYAPIARSFASPAGSACPAERQMPFAEVRTADERYARRKQVRGCQRLRRAAFACPREACASPRCHLSGDKYNVPPTVQYGRESPGMAYSGEERHPRSRCYRGTITPPRAQSMSAQPWQASATKSHQQEARRLSFRRPLFIVFLRSPLSVRRGVRQENGLAWRGGRW